MTLITVDWRIIQPESRACAGRAAHYRTSHMHSGLSVPEDLRLAVTCQWLIQNGVWLDSTLLYALTAGACGQAYSYLGFEYS